MMTCPGDGSMISAGCSYRAVEVLILTRVALYRWDIAPVSTCHPNTSLAGNTPAQITAAIANTASAANIPARSMDVARDARTQSGRVQAAPLAAPARMTISTTAMPAR